MVSQVMMFSGATAAAGKYLKIVEVKEDALVLAFSAFNPPGIMHKIKNSEAIKRNIGQMGGSTNLFMGNCLGWV